MKDILGYICAFGVIVLLISPTPLRAVLAIILAILAVIFEGLRLARQHAARMQVRDLRNHPTPQA